jgi:O-succinylhomoserine sulfhydrylase
LKGLETLDLRVERHSRNAHQVAVFLNNHSNISKVLYPGLATHPDYTLAQKQMRDGGTIVTFELNGGKEKAFQFLNALEIADIRTTSGIQKASSRIPRQRLISGSTTKNALGSALAAVWCVFPLASKTLST